MEIRKGMPGLKQAGCIANERLVKHLAPYGYSPVPFTPSLWRHSSRPVTFSLVVDYFGIKYVGREHLEHLLSALRDQYEITTDETGSKFLGLTLDWDYVSKTVTISMPGYVLAALHRFQHPFPSRTHDAPHSYNKPVFGSRAPQLSPVPDVSECLSASSKTRVQQIVGTFL
jgi:hypothetical protein